MDRMMLFLNPEIFNIFPGLEHTTQQNQIIECSFCIEKAAIYWETVKIQLTLIIMNLVG